MLVLLLPGELMCCDIAQEKDKQNNANGYHMQRMYSIMLPTQLLSSESLLAPREGKMHSLLRGW